MIKKTLIAFIILINIFCVTQCFAEAEYNGYIVKLKDSDSITLFSEQKDDVTESLEAIIPSKNLYKADSEEEVKELMDAGLVEYAEPDYTVTLYDNLFVPADYYYGKSTYQYGINMINADAAWNMGIFGNDVTIGLIDSGIYPHNELIGNTLQGYNYTVSSSVCSKGAKCTDTTCAHYDYVDTYSHGTFCAGIMVAEANSEHMIGAVPAAKIVPLRSFVNQNGSVSNIALAIYDAVDKYDCDVINMSFGLASNSSSLKAAVKYAKDNNVLMVAAAGNDGVNSTRYPGGYDGVVCVGSVDSAGSKSSFSNYGTYVDLAAPGTGIYSCSITSTSGFARSSGTSFAAPYVTAAAAMCRMIDPDITNEEFETLVKSTATPFAEDFSYSLGSGVLNVENMLLSLLEGTEVYYSPINRFNNTTFRMVTNLSESEISFADMWKSDNMIQYNSVDLPANTGYRTDFEEEANTVNYIWESIKSLKPVNKKEFTLN